MKLIFNISNILKLILLEFLNNYVNKIIVIEVYKFNLYFIYEVKL